LLSAVLLLSTFGHAHAFDAPFSDTKTIGALGCQPLHPTTGAEVQFMTTENGLVNLTNYVVRIACPIVKDAIWWKKDTDGNAIIESGAQVAYSYRAGGLPGRVTCTVYVGAHPYGVVAKIAAATLAPAGSSASVSVYVTDPPYNAAANHPANLLCVMDPKTIFLGYRVTEYEMTEL